MLTRPGTISRCHFLNFEKNARQSRCLNQNIKFPTVRTKLCTIILRFLISSTLHTSRGGRKKRGRIHGRTRGSCASIAARCSVSIAAAIRPPRCPGLSGSCQFLAKFRQNVARFRLYRHRFLQLNMRFAAFFKIYQILKLKFLKFGKNLQILRHLQNDC